MNKLFTTFILTAALAGIAAAQAPAKTVPGTAGRAKIAVVEFTSGPNAAAMSAEAKRQLQASIAFALTESKKFEVADVRNTRAASQADLAAINAEGTAAAAVKVGKQLGVSFVLTGTVTEYDTKGSAILRTRLVEVATGKVRYSGETAQTSTSAMRSGGAAEMQTKVLKPAIGRLTEALTGVKL